MAVRKVNAAAFGREAEGELVDALRRSGALALSMVAEEGGRIVGHIAFSPGRVVGDDFEYEAMALGPVAVLPDWQKQGVGSQLVRAGLEALRERGARPVFLLGHVTYYPRFGFEPAQEHGVCCEFDVAPEYFMVWAPLEEPPGRRGTFYFRPEFRDV